MCLRVFRDEVSRHVIDEAQRLHRDAVTFHFNAHIQHVNLQQHSVHAQLHEGQPPQLVGTYTYSPAIMTAWSG